MQDDELTARRLENLEATVRALRDEMEGLRADLRAARAAPADAAPAAPAAPAQPAVGPWPRPAPASPPAARVVRGPERRRTLETKDIESLVGRYGTLALGALTILMAVGAFLGWAITNDL